MEELLQIAENDERWLNLCSVDSERRDLMLRFEVFPRPDNAPGAWHLFCNQVREFSLTQFDGGGLNFWSSDHPVLSQFSSPKASLRARLQRSRSADLLGVLLRSHREAVDDWIEFTKFLEPAVWALSDRQQVIASGPQFLLTAYHHALVDAGFTATVEPHKRRLYWSGFHWSEKPHDVSMIHFGSSHVVAEQFTAMPDLGEEDEGAD